MLEKTVGSKKWDKYSLMAYAWLDLVMFCHILASNFPYKDESVFNITLF